MGHIAKILACYLFLGSLLPGNDYSQLRQVDDLWRHFTLHQTEASNRGEQRETFLSFLWEHLNQPNQHDHGDHGNSHQQLPLQSLGGGLLVFLAQHPHLRLAGPEPAKTAIPMSPVDRPSGDFFRVIFQPPIAA